MSPSYGGEGKNWPNVPAGDYILMWDGASDASIYVQGGTCVETGSAVLTHAADNKRFYTMGGDALNYGPVLVHVAVNAVSGSGSSWTYDFSNLRIYPADVNLSSPAKYRADFIRKLAGIKSLRHGNALKADDNAATFADFNKPQSVLSRFLPVRHIDQSSGVGIHEIRAYTGTRFRPDPDRASVLQMVTTIPHGFEHAQKFWIKGYNGPLATFVDINTGADLPPANLNETYSFARVIDATTLVFQGGPKNSRMTNVLTDPDPAAFLDMLVESSQPIQDQVEICNLANGGAGADYYFTSTVCMTDACLAAVGDYVARNLKAGLKFRFEYGNENWNTSISRSFYWCAGITYENGGSGGDAIPGMCREAARQWAIVRAAWVAAGRDGNDFLRVMGSNRANTGTTAEIASICHALGIAFDELAIAPYWDNRPSSTRYTGPDESEFAAVIDRMVLGQHLDMMEVHLTFGGYDEEFPAHRRALDVYPEFRSVALISYEGGLDNPVLTGGSQINWFTLNHAGSRHPRWYGLCQHVLRLYQDSGCIAFHDYEMSGFDNGGSQWAAYIGTPQVAYAPGDPVQDAIQIDTPERVDLVRSVTGGAFSLWGSLYLAQPTTITAKPPPDKTPVPKKPPKFIPPRRLRPLR